MEEKLRKNWQHTYAVSNPYFFSLNFGCDCNFVFQCFTPDHLKRKYLFQFLGGRPQLQHHIYWLPSFGKLLLFAKEETFTFMLLLLMGLLQIENFSTSSMAVLLHCRHQARTLVQTPTGRPCRFLYVLTRVIC